MKILFAINQAESLRRGINAMASTDRIDVDPGALSPEQRALLATELRDGHDATGLGRIPTPDLAGVVERIEERLAAVAAAVAEKAERIAARIAAADVAAEAWLARVPESVGRRIRLGADGQAVHYGEVVSVLIHVPEQAFFTDASAEVQERLASRREEIRREAERLTAAAVIDLQEGAWAAWATEQGAIKAEYAELYARLPDGLRARDAAKYAAAGEVRKCIEALIRADAGYVSHQAWEQSAPLDALTDTQFETLECVRKTAPEGATITPMSVWSGHRGWRPGGDDDDSDDIDTDGEVFYPGDNYRQAAVVTWTRGGVQVTTAVPLT